MATLTIRNLDDGIAETLKKRARGNHRSLEAEVRLILAEAAARPASGPSRGQALREMALAVAALTPDVPQTDSTTLLREGRER